MENSKQKESVTDLGTMNNITERLISNDIIAESKIKAINCDDSRSKKDLGSNGCKPCLSIGSGLQVGKYVGSAQNIKRRGHILGKTSQSYIPKIIDTHLFNYKVQKVSQVNLNI